MWEGKNGSKKMRKDRIEGGRKKRQESQTRNLYI
jgi:hypothetical protein